MRLCPGCSGVVGVSSVVSANLAGVSVGDEPDLHLGSRAGQVDSDGAQRGRLGQMQQQSLSLDEIRKRDWVLVGDGGPRRVWVAVDRQVGFLRIVRCATG